MQNLEEVQETQANGGLTNAEKLIEEQKQAVAISQQEIKKEFIQQSESLQKRLAERKKRLAVKNSMNNSMSSDMMSDQFGMNQNGPLSTTNAGAMGKGFGRKATVNQGRPMTTKGRGGGFFNTLKPIEHAGG